VDLIPWLLEGDPAIRWQVQRDLAGAGPTLIRRERTRVASEGWGARLLAAQQPDGQWGGGSYSPKWTSTTYTLLLLRHLGIDPVARPTRQAVRRVDANIRLGKSEQPLFGYRAETCITGMALALASYFGVDRDREGIIEFLLDEQLADGGWNCEAARSGSTRSSFNTTISVLEGLLEYERSVDADDTVGAARHRGEDYLLQRGLLRRAQTGELVDKRFTMLSFPPRWYYDVLRALDHLREAGAPPDDRITEALELLESKRRKDGTWPLQNHHPGLEHFTMEPAGKPSRWNTLRALRVLRWANRE
jgi:hypothetical protein